MNQPQNPFSTTHIGDPNGLWQDGALNAKAVMQFLDFNKDDVSKLVNVSKTSIRYDNLIPKCLLDQLSLIAHICNLVTETLDNDAAKTSLWFSTPNPLLGDVTPRDMIRIKRVKNLEKFILSAAGRKNTSCTDHYPHNNNHVPDCK